MELVQIDVGLTANMVTLLIDSATRLAAVVDPAFEVDTIVRAATAHKATITHVLITHSHADHVADLDRFVERVHAPVFCHPGEAQALRELAPVVHVLHDGQRIDIGRSQVRALFTPGHTPTCVCYVASEPAALVTGDVLFVGSIGRIGDYECASRDMYDSLHSVIAALPEESLVYPGHDYGATRTTTLATAFATQRALGVSSFDEWRVLVRK